jgi:hypothetical protein
MTFCSKASLKHFPIAPEHFPIAAEHFPGAIGNFPRVPEKFCDAPEKASAPTVKVLPSKSSHSTELTQS